MTFRVDTAWNLIGSVPDNARVRIAGGRALYEDVIFIDGGRQSQVRLARIEATDDRRLRQINRYVDPDTLLEVVPDEGEG